MKTSSRLKVAIVHNELSPYIIPLFIRLTHSPVIEARVFVTRKTPHGENHLLEFVCSCDQPKLLRRWGDRLGLALPDFALIREVRRFEPEAILLDGLSSIGTGLWFVSTRGSHRAKCYWWSLGAIPSRPMTLRTWFGDRLQSYAVHRCAGLIGYGNHAAAFFRQLGVPANRITVGYNTIDEASILRALPASQARMTELRRELDLGQSPVAVFCGTMREGKRVDLLLKAFACCQRKSGCTDARLVLIGDGPDLPAMKAMSEQLGLSPAVRFVGRQDANASAYFLLGRFVVLPGLGGLAINHAFAHGLPVVCGPADGCEQDLVKTGETGVLLPEVTEESLAATMLDIFARPEDCLRMGRAAQELVKTKITLENYARRVENTVLGIKDSNL